MPVLVIDGFQAVEVDRHHAQPALVPAGLGHGVRQRHVQGAAVAHAGQGVGAGVVFQLQHLLTAFQPRAEEAGRRFQKFALGRIPRALGVGHQPDQTLACAAQQWQGSHSLHARPGQPRGQRPAPQIHVSVCHADQRIVDVYGDGSGVQSVERAER